MKTFTLLISLFIFVSTSMALGQQQGKDTYISKEGRLTDHGGSLTFFTKTDGKLYIKAEDNYRSRIIGLRDGYTSKDLMTLLSYIENSTSILCFISFRKLCMESDKLDSVAESNLLGGVLKMNRLNEGRVELNSKDYWHLYDIIEEQGMLEGAVHYIRGPQTQTH